MQFVSLRRALAAVTLTSVAGLVAASAAVASSGSSKAAATVASSSSKNVVLAYGDPGLFDPIQYKSNTGFMITNNIYGTLTRENYVKKNGVLVGNSTYSMELAKSFSWNKAGTLLTITLKPGEKFQDGSPLTSADVVYTIQRALSPVSYASAFATYLGIKNPTTDVKAVNPTTLTLKTTFKSVLVEKFLSFPLYGILDAAQGKAHATASDPWAEKWFASNVNSSGPYELQSYTPDSQTVLTKNPNFTAENLASAPATVTVKDIPDPNQEYLALEEGSVNVAMGLSPQLAKKAEGTSGVHIDSSPAGDLVYLGMNNTDPALKKLAVRQAISYLLPYTALRKDVMDGFANSADGPVPYPMATALGGATATPYPTNVTKAKSLLKSAGESGMTLTISVDASVATEVESATFIQSALEKGGITVKVAQIPSSQFTADLSAHKLQSYIEDWYSWGEDPIYQEYFLLTSGSAVDYGEWKDPAYNAIVAKGIVEENATKRDKLSQQAQKVAIEQAPMGFLYTQNYLVGTSKGTSGVTQPDDEMPYVQYFNAQ